jgi:hypothetical protein
LGNLEDFPINPPASELHAKGSRSGREARLRRLTETPIPENFHGMEDSRSLIDKTYYIIKLID